jgi:RNA polymerase sigma-70 factor (ECF subfamily)
MDQDIELARRVAAGDAAAISALVRAHEAAVRRFLRQLAGASGDDLAQETFLKAWRLAGRYRGEGRYRAWLMRIAWTTFLEAQRAGRRREMREDSALPPQAPAHPDLRIDLQRALAALNERERAAALLCFSEGCSHGEAAEIMGVPLGTLKSIVARARAALVETLEP